MRRGALNPKVFVRLEVGAVAAVAAGVAVAEYTRRLRADLVAARRDNDEFVAAAVRGTLFRNSRRRRSRRRRSRRRRRRPLGRRRRGRP